MKDDIYSLYLQYSQEQIYEILKENNGEIVNEGKNGTSLHYNEFDLIYTVIYRSQIDMLEKIRSDGNIPMLFESTFKFYENHLKCIPESKKFYANPAPYFQWLEDVKLIDGGDGGYILTTFGLKFLKYIKDKECDLELKVW